MCVFVCVCGCVRARWRRVGGKENSLAWRAGQKKKRPQPWGSFLVRPRAHFFFLFLLRECPRGH
jgi:hypothetical protein